MPLVIFDVRALWVTVFHGLKVSIKPRKLEFNSLCGEKKMSKLAIIFKKSLKIPKG